MSYPIAEPAFQHQNAARVGVLLVNLGTPEAPTPKALRPYLRQFLSDRRVIEIPRPVWWLILNAFILPFRPRKSAEKYATIWTPEGSPLKLHTEKQAKLLKGLLGDRLGDHVMVGWAMRYGKPAVADVLAEMKAKGCDRILLLPMYPQYAASSVGSAMDEVFRALQGMRNPPELRVIKHFHDEPAYIEALADKIRRHWALNGRGDHLLLSFHGVPRFTLDKGDPYHCECLKTGRLLREALGLPTEQVTVAFQSRFGKAEWLKPYVVDSLKKLGKAKVGKLDVICPGFVADCLETLEEIAMEGKATFLSAGGGEFRYIPCLNEDAPFIAALAGLAERHMQGWDLAKPDPAVLEQRRLQAKAAGAEA